MLLRKVLLCVLVVCSCQTGNTAPLPWNDKPYSHYSDEEPLAEMLESLAANQGTPITVSEKVDDVVSMHYKNKPSKVIFEDVAKTYGLIWYYDGEAIFVYKEEEAKRGSVSMKTMSPSEFSEALERLNILDSQYHWEISEIDNVIYFTGPERFVDSVVSMAKLMDNKPKKRSKIFKWTDARGRVNFSNERPLSSRGSDKDIAAEDRSPGFDVVDVIDR